MIFSKYLLPLGALLTTALSQTVPQNVDNSTYPPIFPLNKDTEFAFVLEEMLALSNGGGANTGEVLRAATRIIPGSFESFYSAFFFFAEKIHSQAVSALKGGFKVSARDAFFRSSTYYRAADFFLHGNITDPRIYSLWDSALADFDSALSLMDIPGVRFNITSGHGFTVPVIFYKAKDCNEKTPTVLACSGYDGSQEEMYHQIGTKILERGWNFVSYEGPGQPTVRRQQNIGFRPDWWDVVTPVVDWLATRGDVDMDRLALEGISFGGTLAPRAASREHRFAAVLSVDGLDSLFDVLYAAFGPQIAGLFDSGNKTAFDVVMKSLQTNSSLPAQTRWIIDQGEFAFNTTSAFEWWTGLKTINLTKDIIEPINVPIFIGKGQDDASTDDQPELMRKLAESVGKTPTYHFFETDLGAGEHCQLGAESQLAMVTMDWLDGVFKNVTGKNKAGEIGQHHWRRM
ncbi:alpha/beta-hydrolase [Rhizodiscina lignyota]|uniref:Alpha/beta-hydrolase n=1 Tax=Rhizodiscina lignyota TaxID=1504668 RepID=A0A9P4IMN7_9PEZI|nr:alpha/beta-hydrolase [Rhizodiscina lignyota]